MGKVFSKSEIRAVAVLLPLLGVGIWIAAEAVRTPKSSGAADTTEVAAPADTVSLLRAFDPNTVTYEQLRTMGIEPFVARNIVKYRAAGRTTYQIPEDVAAVYGVSDSLYAELKPCIRIGAEYRLKPHSEAAYTASKAKRAFTGTPFDPNTLDAEGFYALGCFTSRQAEAMVEYRRRIGGFRSVGELRDCYLITDSLFVVLEPFVKLSPLPEPTVEILELNGADSAALVAVSGIGAKSAHDIIEYRRRLGGYYSIDQLKELAVVTERNFELFSKEIRCDSCKIQKIDINFAPPKELGGHPYLTPARVRKILKHRQLKGGWTTIEEMVNANILTQKEAERLAPYLQFNPTAK